MRGSEEGERETLGVDTTGGESCRAQGGGELRGRGVFQECSPQRCGGRQAKEGRHAVGKTKTKNLNGNHERMVWNQI